MDYNILSPYVRCAIHSEIKSPFAVSDRIILDYELIFVEDGGCRLVFDGKTYDCVKNDVIFIRPGIEHRFEGIRDVNFRQPHVHFDLCYEENSPDVFICFKKYDDLSDKAKRLLRRDIVDIDIPPVIKLNNPQYFKAQLYELIDAFADKDKFSEILCKEKMLGLLYIIFKKYDVSEAKAASYIKNEMKNIKNYIDGNFAQKISLLTLSLNFFMNKYYIEEKFKNAYGITVIKYYHTVRFNKACEMLAGGIRVSDVSDALGFDSIYAFSRFFKNFCGKSPSRWQKTESEG